MSNIVKVLQTWAQKQAQHNAVLFLEDGEQETASLTYAELDHKAKAIAALLQAHELQNQRVLLVYPTGVEFIASLIGCWYAGAIAVPLSCPKLEDLSKQRTLFNTLSEDADVAAVLALDSYRGPLKKLIKRKIIACATDKISPKMAENVQPTKITDKTIAYLQYTSGSTSAPKAATISHGNLQQNIRDTIDAWHYDQNSVTVNWAPHTHVYGLVCGLLVPLYHGTPAIIMPPAVFINKPSLWLRALSKYQGTHGGCPNFGYDLCVRHVLENEVSELDLQHWQVAVNGGDMVQARTLNAFVEKFSACGFALKHFSSAYGMSEVSGAIAVTPFGTEPEEFIDADQRRLISSGKLLSGFQALAVDPESKTALPEGEVGEIWLHGKSVISGYWQRPEENQEVFDVQVADSKLRYFRTGDLGFIRDQQIYLTGRLKEVMVIYGKKYYPLDLEMTVAKNLVPWEINLPQVAFSLEIAGKEQIIIAQELNHYSNEQGQQLSDLIRHAITKAHGVDVHEVIFSPPGSIPKTASGKLQRKRAQLLFKEGQFARFAQEEIKQTTQQLPSHEPFVQLVADVLNIDPKHIDLEAPLSRYAFDSVNMIHFTNRINETYGLNLSPAALYEFTSLAAFYVDHIQSQNTPVVQTKNDTVIQQECNDIAIIGMSGIFPQAADLDDFWNNLALGKDCISELPRARWNTEEFAVQWGGFIDHVDQFDAAFFNISPREAELIDPQQRLFLQTVWKTIEDSGYAPDAIAAVKTGLFVGVFNHDYAELLQQQGVMDAYLTTGTMNSMIANRISYVLNLRGPSEAIDTACSSSLVAIHQAVSAILQGDCELAIAGGVNILSSATSFNSANQAGMLSQDGRCKTFDKDANGYVRGEGVGAILLKKLSQALTDGDQIHGVIKGTAVNHGGHVNTLTAPNPNAQAEVIVSACQRAQIPVESIQYIETHGTGTPLGDPIEINGLKKAFQQLALVQEKKDLGKNYCALGAVKTHIGHLESAAGIAGLIKMLLALRHQTLPANLHLNTVNPYIDITDSPFYLLDKSYPWPKGQTTPRRAGISSFGFGGANAHIVIEEAPASEKRADYPHQDYLICLSAQTEIALEQRKKDLHTWLTQQNSSPCLATLSYTLNVGRQHFAQRFAVIVSSVEELLTALAAGENSTINSTSALQVFGQKYRQGEAIAWQSIYGDFQQRMSLPTYPFAKDSHWIAQKAQRLGRLHALLDANQSTLNQVLFSKRFQGNEFYLQEHQVHQEKVLPGALCLEMAYVAANLALKNQPVRAMSQIIWQKPIKSFELQHTLELQLTAAGQDVAFSLGYAQEQFVSGRIHYSSATPLFHLNKVSEFPKQQSPEAIYAYFKKAGLNYGASFQVIKQLQYNDTQLLAELELAENIAIEGYQLHPCLLDGVLQCTQALLKNRQNLYLPFSINHLTLHAPLTRSCQVWVHLSSAPDEEAFPTFNIQVTDLEGKSLLDIHEFTLAAVVNETVSTAYYQPQWVAQAPQADSSMLGKVLVLASQQNQLERLHKELGLEQADYALLEQFTRSEEHT
ncbi:MAG: beta-ketoacyl synthase, partial [Legionella sp.]